MKYKQSKYPIGATWQGKTSDGKTVIIWHDGISDYGWEIWRWNCMYSDGSGCEFDWATSLASCKKHTPSIEGRFKRIK